ncbi:MAG: M1 family metallopeptidase, partial [Bacteroidota bacterium]
MKKLLFCLSLILLGIAAQAQPERWQQRVKYEMSVDMNVRKHQYQGVQHLTYYNNSPDTLNQVFYHLYFNAFQPNSMMDVRSRTIEDADPRVADRIFKLKDDEQGWIKVKNLSQNGKALKYDMNETILEVKLAQPILPHDSTVFDMNWDAQVPLQIRRSGRDNYEGVAYSMSQWYPKLCEYDYQGWHSNPYIAREFYGVWGDYDVKISIDKQYVVAAGGYLQNPEAVGNGYENPGQTVQQPGGDKLLYHFVAPNVHDFVWAADPEFTHSKITAEDGSIMHFFWQKDKGYDDQWGKLPAIMSHARSIMDAHCGKYPYKEYYFIQGGDGGMEYPMATLISGNRPLNSLVGVAVHEQLHSWYQMVLGSNESLYAWMDEGFTSYAETLVENQLAAEGLLGNKKADARPFEGTYRGYVALATSSKEEPMTTHADHYNTNYAYSLDAYVKGAV